MSSAMPTTRAVASSVWRARPARRAPPAVRGALWAAPLALSVLFVLGVIIWAQRNDRDEREELRKTMISDALSLEAQLRAKLDEETLRVNALAAQLRNVSPAPNALDAQPEVVAGLRRVWMSVTWLDSRNRILAPVPDPVPCGRPGAALRDDEPGLSMHIAAPIGAGPSGAPVGVVVARYAPAVLLKRGVPWWLARKYDVQLVDTLDQVIASTGDSVPRAKGDSYRVSFGGSLGDVYLQLTQRELNPPGLHTLPFVLIGGFLVLIVAATALLRRQVQQVTRAEASWRSEAAWRGAMEDSALVGLDRRHHRPQAARGARAPSDRDDGAPCTPDDARRGRVDAGSRVESAADGDRKLHDRHHQLAAAQRCARSGRARRARAARPAGRAGRAHRAANPRVPDPARAAARALRFEPSDPRRRRAAAARAAAPWCAARVRARPGLARSRRRSSADRAGRHQPRSQRRRCARDALGRAAHRGAERARRVARPAAALRSRRRRRQRAGHRRAARRAAVRAVLLDQARGHGHGARNLPLD